MLTASVPFNSSSDNNGTQSAMSSSDIFPFFINLSAVFLASSCLSLLINDFIICSLSNKLIIIVTTSFSLVCNYTILNCHFHFCINKIHIIFPNINPVGILDILIPLKTAPHPNGCGAVFYLLLYPTCSSRNNHPCSVCHFLCDDSAWFPHCNASSVFSRQVHPYS